MNMSKICLILASLAMFACAGTQPKPQEVILPTPVLPTIDYTKCGKMPIEDLTDQSTWQERLDKHRQTILLQQLCIENEERLLDSLKGAGK
jgi:hypothetical protein